MKSVLTQFRLSARPMRHEQGPPDLSELLRRFMRKKTSSGGAGDGSSDSAPSGVLGFVLLIAIILIVIWIIAGIFIVSPAEESVVLRFGRYVATKGPGLHWIPRLVQTKYTLNVQQVNSFAYQSEMLTRDENIVSVSLAVQFRIDNPRDFLFNVDAPVQTLQQATSSAIRQVVGNMTLDAVLTTGRQELATAVLKHLRVLLDTYKVGLAVTDVALQPIKPPEAVTDAFDDAIKAREDEQRYINKAEAYARKVISTTAGQVARIKQSAEAYKKEVVLQAQGETARYLAILKPYQAAPTVTRTRLYLDTMATVLSDTSNIVLDTQANNLLYLPLQQLLSGKTVGQTPTVMPPLAAAGSTDLSGSTSSAGGDRNTLGDRDSNTTPSATSTGTTPSAYLSQTRPSYPYIQQDQGSTGDNR